jgi:hypothetical protein
MNLQQARSGQDAHGDYNQVPVENPSEILDDLSVLLEEHAPSWYSEKERERVFVARRLPTEVLVELYALLEDYGPTWYTEEQHERAISVLRAFGLMDGGMEKQS